MCDIGGFSLVWEIIYEGKTPVLYLGIYDVYLPIEWSYLIYSGHLYLDDKTKIKYFLTLYVYIGLIPKYFFLLFSEKVKHMSKTSSVKK